MLLVLFYSLVAVAMAQNHCPYGPDTCLQGYVWREAFPNDHVCVPPSTRTQAAADNAAVASRRSPNGGAFGSDTCLSGYVWREANPFDHVCVPPSTRTQTANDNRIADTRVVCDCGSGYTKCEQNWFGTAPFCSGSCPDGWSFVRSSGSSGTCDGSKRGACVQCDGGFGNSCWSGSKVLCQQCVGVITQS